MTTASTSKHSRSLWPRAISAYFILVIVGIAIFVTWAVRQNMDLVRKDYYAEEIQFQQHLDQMNRVRQLNWKPEIGYDRVQDVVIVFLSNRSSSISGRVQFYRPSDASLDKNIKLSLNHDGSQQIDARNLSNGLWKVRISWIADAKEFFSEETIVINRT
jgi:nitrogen fixation protein FixH